MEEAPQAKSSLELEQASEEVVPFNSIKAEPDIPLDEGRVALLRQDFLEPTESNGSQLVVRGMIEHLWVVKREDQYWIINGLHRYAALAELIMEGYSVFENVKVYVYDLTDKEFWYFRAQASVPHESINHPRFYYWLISTWENTFGKDGLEIAAAIEIAQKCASNQPLMPNPFFAGEGDENIEAQAAFAIELQEYFAVWHVSIADAGDLIKLYSKTTWAVVKKVRDTGRGGPTPYALDVITKKFPSKAYEMLHLTLLDLLQEKAITVEFIGNMATEIKSIYNTLTGEETDTENTYFSLYEEIRELATSLRTDITPAPIKSRIRFTGQPGTPSYRPIESEQDIPEHTIIPATKSPIGWKPDKKTPPKRDPDFIMLDKLPSPASVENKVYESILFADETIITRFSQGDLNQDYVLNIMHLARHVITVLQLETKSAGELVKRLLQFKDDGISLEQVNYYVMNPEVGITPEDAICFTQTPVRQQRLNKKSFKQELLFGLNAISSDDNK